MDYDFDKALKNWDFYSIAKLNGKEVKVPRPITVCYTPTRYQIKVMRRG